MSLWGLGGITCMFSIVFPSVEVNYIRPSHPYKEGTLTTRAPLPRGHLYHEGTLTLQLIGIADMKKWPITKKSLECTSHLPYSTTKPTSAKHPFMAIINEGSVYHKYRNAWMMMIFFTRILCLQLNSNMTYKELRCNHPHK